MCDINCEWCMQPEEESSLLTGVIKKSSLDPAGQAEQVKLQAKVSKQKWVLI